MILKILNTIFLKLYLWIFRYDNIVDFKIDETLNC